MKKKLVILLLASIWALHGCGSSKASELPASNQQSAIEDDPEEELPYFPGSTDAEQSSTITESDLNNAASEPTFIEPEYVEGSTEKELQNYAAKIITENYTYTTIDSITINEDLGTEEEGDYVVLARLTWEQKNSGSTSKEVLAMYSSDLAARFGTDQLSVKEIAIFWTVPYLNDANAKWAYERVDSGMQLSDNMLDNAFSQ